MRIILAIFHDRYEAFSSLKPFLEKYPEFSNLKDSINYHMSRKKSDFVHELFTLQRLNVEKTEK